MTSSPSENGMYLRLLMLEVRTVREEVFIYRGLVLYGEYKVLVAGKIQLIELETGNLSLVLFLDGLRVLNSRGVIHRTDLHYDCHLSVVVEIDEGIDSRGISAVFCLESYLKCTDILHLLDSHAFTVVSLLVEVDRFHNAADNRHYENDDNDREYKPSQNLFKCWIHIV